MSVTYGYIRLIESYRFSCSSLEEVVKTPVGKSHESLKTLKEDIVDNEYTTNFVIEIEEDRTIKDFEKDYPDEIEKLEEA